MSNNTPDMTMRDYFAAAALSAMNLRDGSDYSITERKCQIDLDDANIAADTAYRYADAMIQARKSLAEIEAEIDAEIEAQMKDESRRGTT